MKSVSLVLTAVFVLVTGIPASAHHAFAGTYLLDQTATIEGTIVQFGIRNPHSFLNINVKDADGKTTLWGVEWGAVSLLTQTGVTVQTLKLGDTVTIIGLPPRNANEHKLLMQKIRRASDGWSWGYQPGEALPGYSLQPLSSTPGAPARVGQIPAGSIVLLLVSMNRIGRECR